jgi:SAM-dependent methyltransferase
MSRQRFDLFGLEGEFHNMDAADTQAMTALGKFDLVYSCGVLHHYPDMTACLDNIHNALDLDGEFRMLVYAKNSWKAIMIEAGLDQPEAQAGCPIVHTYSKKDIQALLSGFRIMEIRQDHIFPYVISHYLKQRYVLQPWFKVMPNAMFMALKKKLGWHWLIRAKR